VFADLCIVRLQLALGDEGHAAIVERVVQGIALHEIEEALAEVVDNVSVCPGKGGIWKAIRSRRTVVKKSSLVMSHMNSKVPSRSSGASRPGLAPEWPEG
jgi:hypothetical protein